MAINVLNGNFMVGVPIYDDWTHVVMNFVGPNDEEGLKGYSDGRLWDTDSSLLSWTFLPGDGRIVVGRTYADNSADIFYANYDLDELFIFNEKLSEDQILAMKNFSRSMNTEQIWKNESYFKTITQFNHEATMYKNWCRKLLMFLF